MNEMKLDVVQYISAWIWLRYMSACLGAVFWVVGASESDHNHEANEGTDYGVPWTDFD